VQGCGYDTSCGNIITDFEDNPIIGVVSAVSFAECFYLCAENFLFGSPDSCSTFSYDGVGSCTLAGYSDSPVLGPGPVGGPGSGSGSFEGCE